MPITSIGTECSCRMRAAAPDGTELKPYDAEHDMEGEDIRADRLAFLEQALGVAG